MKQTCKLRSCDHFKSKSAALLPEAPVVLQLSVVLRPQGSIVATTIQAQTCSWSRSKHWTEFEDASLRDVIARLAPSRSPESWEAVAMALATGRTAQAVAHRWTKLSAAPKQPPPALHEFALRPRRDVSYAEMLKEQQEEHEEAPQQQQQQQQPQRQQGQQQQQRGRWSSQEVATVEETESTPGPEPALQAGAAAVVHPSVGRRLVVSYEEEKAGTMETVCYHGVVGDYHPEEGMLVFFDNAPDKDALWVQVNGEDEWEWECATASEVATAVARRLSATHAKRKRASEAEFITAEWLETRSAQWRQLALGKKVRRGEPITTERTDRACFVALQLTAAGVRLSLALARRAVAPPPPTKRWPRRPRRAPSEAPSPKEQAVTQELAVPPPVPSEACKACAGKHRSHTCGWQSQPRPSQRATTSAESEADSVEPVGAPKAANELEEEPEEEPEEKQARCRHELALVTHATAPCPSLSHGLLTAALLSLRHSRRVGHSSNTAQ